MFLESSTFDSDFRATLYSDDTFIISGFGGTKHATLSGSVTHVGRHGTLLRGTFVIFYADGGFGGMFSLTKT